MAAALGFAGESGGCCFQGVQRGVAGAIYRGCRAALACGPSCGAAARVRAGLLELESRSDGRKEKPPDGRAPLGRERRGGRGGEAGRAAVWAGKREVGRREGEFGPREKKKKKGRGRWDGPAGLKTRGGKRKDFAFFKLNQTIQFKLKFREFKFEPNNKQ